MNKKLLIVLAATIAVVVVGAFGFTVVKGVVIKNDPINYLLYSATHNNYEAVDASFDGKLLVDESALIETLNFISAEPEAMAKFITSMINEVSFTGDVKMKFDMEDKSYYLKETVNMNYTDKPLFVMGIAAQNEQMVISSDTLIDKAFVLTKKDIFDLVKEQSEIDLNLIDFDKYIDLLNMENDPLYKTFIKDYEDYESILRDGLKSLEKGDKIKVTLSGGEKVNCDVLELTLTMDEITKLYIDLLSEAKIDTELKALVKGKSIEMLKLVLSSEDYVLLKMESSDITDAIEEIETNFDTTWETSLDEIIYMYQDAQYELQKTAVEPAIYNMAFAIDSKYNMRQIKSTVSMMGIGMEQTITYNAYNDDVKLDKIVDPEATISIKQMMEDPAFATEVGLDVVDQGLTNIIDGEALSLIMADLETKSEVLPEAERQSIIDVVNYFFENKESLKETIINSMGL